MKPQRCMSMTSTCSWARTCCCTATATWNSPRLPRNTSTLRSGAGGDKGATVLASTSHAVPAMVLTTPLQEARGVAARQAQATLPLCGALQRMPRNNKPCNYHDAAAEQGPATSAINSPFQLSVTTLSFQEHKQGSLCTAAALRSPPCFLQLEGLFTVG